MKVIYTPIDTLVIHEVIHLEKMALLYSMGHGVKESPNGSALANFCKEQLPK